jgi:hypothetical protein
MTRRNLFPALAFSMAALPALMVGGAPTTQLAIHVLSPGGKPLDRASVIVRFVASTAKIKIKSTRTTWETKTDQEGYSRIPAIPQGKIQIQIIATGYQTFGQMFDVAEAEKTIEIRLNPPQNQYSAHDKDK